MYEFPENPQISAPTMGIPKKLLLTTYPIDNLRCSNDAMLSPVQCAAYLPVPKELLLVKIKGYSLGF